MLSRACSVLLCLLLNSVISDLEYVKFVIGKLMLVSPFVLASRYLVKITAKFLFRANLFQTCF